MCSQGLRWERGGAQIWPLHFFSPDFSSLLPKLKCPPADPALPRSETIPMSNKCLHSLMNASHPGLG